MKMPYRYALIKFMPFPETGEFANIGIIAILDVFISAHQCMEGLVTTTRCH